MNDRFPPSERGEKYVRDLFDHVARRYDLLNRLISFHLDTRWRRRTVRAALRWSDRLILDLGTGTGDLAAEAARTPGALGRLIVGLDPSFEMLRYAGIKLSSRPGVGPLFLSGSGIALPFKGGRFDLIMTTFVLRNIPDLPLFFREAYRVTRSGGRLAALDMYPPPPSIFGRLYGLYFYRVVPWIGAGVAGQRSAYRYLAESVKSFGPPETVAAMMRQAGFRHVSVDRFLRGAVCLHLAEKSAGQRPGS